MYLRNAGAIDFMADSFVRASLMSSNSIFTQNQLGSEESKDRSEQSNHKSGHTPTK